MLVLKQPEPTLIKKMSAITTEKDFSRGTSTRQINRKGKAHENSISLMNELCVTKPGIKIYLYQLAT